MPAIIFLRRSWSFASDEFVLPAIFDVIMRTLCMLLMGIPFCVAKDVPQCLPSTVSKVFFVAVFILVFIFMVIEIFLAVLSSKGGVMQIHKRSGVPDLLLTLLVLSIIELAVHIANIYFATTFRSPCTRTISGIFLAGNVLRIFQNVQYYLWLGTHFRKTGADWGRVLREERTTHQGFLAHDANINTKLQAYELLHQSVRRRLQRLNSMKTSRTRRNRAETEEQHAISSAAALFSEVFYDVDLVASDIMAGLLLLRWQSNQWVGCGHRVPYHLIERDSVPCDVYGGGDSVPISEKHTVDQQPNASVFGDVRSSRSPNEDVSWLNMSRLQRVCQMGISIYGKLFFCCLFRGKPNATCRLCRHLTCDCRKKPGASSQDAHIGCCLCTNHNCDLAAVMEMGSIELDHFVTITFENTLYHSPYFVAIDDRSQIIVIAVRGTLSLDDTIVDLLYDGIRLEEIETIIERQTGTRPTFVGHRGMVGSARRLYQRLLADGVIENAQSKRPGYGLVVCGHSLGAGIASFLTLLLRPIYPEVKGYALSAPLGMMNDELAEYTKPFLVSIIYGFDAFSRVNKSTIMDFKWRLVDALSVCTIPKYRILSRGAELCLGRCFFRCCSPCCLPKLFAERTVGRDTQLLDEETQDRLIYPNPETPRWDPITMQATPTEQGDAVAPVVSTSAASSKWPSRLIQGERSLLNWMDSQSARLFCSDTIGSDVRAGDCAQPPQFSKSSESIPNTGEQKSYELRDAVFGGRVLHIVDVDLSGSGPPFCDRPHRPSTSSESDQPAWSVNSEVREPFLSGDVVNDYGCCSTFRGPQATVAVWTTSDQFKTLLIHPRMFLDHSPDNFLRAVNRIHATVTQDPVFANPYIKPSEAFRRMKHASMKE